MRCLASGSPQPVIRWFKDRKPLELIPGNTRVSVLSDGSLQFRNLTMSDRGMFECEAANVLGVTYSGRAGVYPKEKEGKAINAIM